MIRTDIYVGRTNKHGDFITVKDVVDVVRRTVEGATVTEAVGVWQGSTEPSTVVTVYHEKGQGGFTRELAHTLKDAFRQDAVLVTEHEVTTALI